MTSPTMPKKIFCPNVSGTFAPRCLCLRNVRHAGDLDVRILRDGLRDARCHQRDGGVVVVLAQDRNHLAAEAADFAVGQDRFESVTDFCPILMVLHGEKNEYAAVSAFLADAPLLEQLVRELLFAFAFQRLDSDDGDLRVRLLLHFKTQSVQPRLRLLVKYAGEVVDVIAGLELCWFFGECECRKNRQESRQNADRQNSQTAR